MANVTGQSVLVRVAKNSLCFASWLVALWWLALRFAMPTEKGRNFRKVTVGNRVGQSAFIGKSATTYVLFSCPVIALAIFALLYLELEKRYPTERNWVLRKNSRAGRIYRAMWTHPLVVRSPLGILTSIDILGIAVVLLTVAWCWGELLSTKFVELATGEDVEPGQKMWQMKLNAASAELGGVIPFTIPLLFLPVTRGSPILRLIDVPFEQAVKYHRWLGHLTMVLVTVHGVTYAIYAGSIHEVSLLAEWKPDGVSNLAGVISLIAGIFMWATSVALVRRRFFDLFYAVHHLYLVFFAFYVFHVGWGHMGNDMGPIFLFFVDRFLRMVQSRREVPGVSARVLSSGHVELKIPKHSGSRASPLSFFYINIPRISPVEWHPFSVTSSPFENSVTMTIKPLGDWTHKLQTTAMAMTKETSAGKTSSFCPFAMKLHAEGPYGHDSNYYLRYDNLILIAGGVGVTPFLAILRDLLIRYELQQQDLPSKVQVIWCVKRSSELVALQDICPTQLYPGYAFEHPKRLTLDVHAYVTAEQTTYTSCNPKSGPLSTTADASHKGFDHKGAGEAIAKGRTGFSSNSNLWLVAIILFSVAGFVVTAGFLHQFVVAPHGHTREGIGALETVLFFVSMFVGIIICGGAVILLWLATGQSIGQISTGNEHGSHPDAQDHLSILELHEDTLLQSCIVTKNTRPNFEDVFSGAAAKQAGEEIGVLVSGTQGLHESVASACRSQNFCSQTQFHLHSVSFDF